MMEILYKYQPINKFTYNILTNNEFYLSFSNEFNDPFDSIVFPTFSILKQNLNSEAIFKPFGFGYLRVLVSSSVI